MLCSVTRFQAAYSGSSSTPQAAALTGNVMSDNSISNFSLNGLVDAHFDNRIDTSNTVEGRPVYYVSNAVGRTYDGSTNAGVFYCISCTDVTVRGLSIGQNGVGVFLWKTQNSMIENVLALRNVWRIYLAYSNYNTLAGNSANGNERGIYLFSSSGNMLRGNVASGNGFHGIIVENLSNDNTLDGNTAVNNDQFGICVLCSIGNTLTRNTTAKTTTVTPSVFVGIDTSRSRGTIANYGR